MHEIMARTSDVEYRFNYHTSRTSCALCGTEFEPRIGTWPFLAGTDSAVCGDADCPIGEDVTGTSPCDTLFEFAPLARETIQTIAALESEELPVAERFRRAALDESLPDEDRALLRLAAIDLQFCEADGTRIQQLEPNLLLRTCGEAAAEMLLSGCGDIAG